MAHSRRHVLKSLISQPMSEAASAQSQDFLQWRRFQKSFHWQKDKTLYEHLDKNLKEFRLLIVYAGKDDDPIRAELRLARLNSTSSPQYETISYCWGEPRKTAPIRLNNRKVAVPASSAAAIRAVRLPDLTRIVWIDALCINQEDFNERSVQVAMMADIYSRSQRNLVYLGEADSNTERAVKSISLILSDIKERTKNFQDILDTPFDRKKQRYFDDVGCEADEPALISFYSREWFRRVWAFQEAALAPSSVCFLGRFRLDLLEVLRVACWIWYHESSFTYALRDNRGLWCASELYDFVDQVFGKFYTDGGKPPTLTIMMETSTRLLASDSRDHIYGLIGLWRNMNSKISLPVTLAPNYHKPIGHAFRDATRAALKEYGDLQIWSVVSHRHEEDMLSDNIPSWALVADRPFDVEQDPVDFYHQFNSDLKWPMVENSHEIVDDDLIVIQGINIGHVLGVTAVFDLQGFNDYELTKAWMHNVVLDVQQKLKNKASYDDIARVLLAGLNANEDTATQDDLRGFFDLLEYFDYEQTWDTQATQDRMAAMNTYWTNMSFCLNRRVLVTDANSIALGPKLTRAGDEVVIFYGGNVPFVLRPDGEQYRLVGECYVQGVMQGEAMNKHIVEGSPSIEYRIR